MDSSPGSEYISSSLSMLRRQLNDFSQNFAVMKTPDHRGAGSKTDTVTDTPNSKRKADVPENSRAPQIRRPLITREIISKEYSSLQKIDTSQQNNSQTSTQHVATLPIASKMPGESAQSQKSKNYSYIKNHSYRGTGTSASPQPQSYQKQLSDSEKISTRPLQQIDEERPENNFLAVDSSKQRPASCSSMRARADIIPEAKANISVNIQSSSGAEKRQQVRPSENKTVTVSGTEYQVLKLLGQGGSSKVYHVYNPAKGDCLAMKIVSLTDPETKAAYLNEILLLKKLQFSEYVIKLHDYEVRTWKDKSGCEKARLYAVLEKGDVDFGKFLKTREGKMTDSLISYYWSEMLKAVQAVHEQGVIHSDLKPANFLLVGGNLKIIDFGIAATIVSNKTSVTRASAMGTLNYISPEMITTNSESKVKGSLKSDVWSLGCILYQMVYGKTPFRSLSTQAQQILAISNPKCKIKFGDIFDKDLLDVMQRCLQRKPNMRPTVDELLKHRYLTKKNENAEPEPSKMLSSSLPSETDRRKLYEKMGEMFSQNTPRTNARMLERMMGSGCSDADPKKSLKFND